MEVTVTKDKVSITAFTPVHEGEYGVNTCTFTLPAAFAGLDVTAVFNGLAVPLIGGTCTIPTLPRGDVLLGVYATRTVNGTVQVVYSPVPAKFSVTAGSFTDETAAPEAPTLSEYEQYCLMLRDYCAAQLTTASGSFYTKAEVDAALAQKATGTSVNTVNANSDNAHVPTARAVETRCQAVYNDLCGALDAVGALVGGDAP